MPQRGDQNCFRIMRIDDDAGDLPAVGKTAGLPGLTAVGRTEHALPLGDVRAHVCLARSDVENLRSRRRDRQRTDRPDGDAIEDRIPRPTGIACLPNTAVHRPKVEMQRRIARAGHRQYPAAAVRPDRPPFQGGGIRP